MDTVPKFGNGLLLVKSAKAKMHGVRHSILNKVMQYLESEKGIIYRFNSGQIVAVCFLMTLDMR